MTETLAISVSISIVVVAIVMPGYVRRWIVANALPLLGMIALLGLMGAGIHFSRALKPTWLAGLAGFASVAVVVAIILFDARYRSWLKFLSVDQWRAIDEETTRDAGGKFDWRVLVVLVVAAVSLTLQEYIGDRGAFERWFPSRGPNPYYELRGFAWWSAWRVIGYVILPIAAILLMPGERVRDYNLSARGFFHHLWIYITLFALVLPAVIIASTTDQFRHTYPFYRMANRSQFDLWSWETLYAAQFLSLEIFFRGFLLQGLRRALGSNAIFVMIVPYCMIHYGKPMTETLGAIGAGVILGTVAMRTKSIWGGVLIHVGVAMTMDVLALRGCPPMGSKRWCGS
jgi:membrane protease YdiL (CAAX protease family)